MAGRPHGPVAHPTTVSEFLAWDDGTDTRYELVSGVVVAMAPASDRHGLVAANVIATLAPRLPPGCKIRSEAGVLLPHRADAFYVADAAISCAPPSDAAHVPDPVVIFEILSPGTVKEDRGIKLLDYRQIPTIRDIVLIAADSFRVEHWVRSGDGWTVRDVIGRDTRISLSGFDIEVRLAELYDGLPSAKPGRTKSPRRRAPTP